MRSLENQEIDSVAGGWDAVFHFGIVDVNVSGQELVGAYDWAVGQMSDFFTWWDPAGYYNC